MNLPDGAQLGATPPWETWRLCPLQPPITGGSHYHGSGGQCPSALTVRTRRWGK